MIRIHTILYSLNNSLGIATQYLSDLGLKITLKTNLLRFEAILEEFETHHLDRIYKKYDYPIWKFD